MVQTGKLTYTWWAGRFSSSTYILTKPEQVWSNFPRDASNGFIPDGWFKARGCKWLSHTIREQSLSLSSYSWQNSSNRKPPKRKNGLQGPVCVWDGGGMLSTPTTPSGHVYGREASPQLGGTTAVPLQISKPQPSPLSNCQLLGRS